MPFQQQVNIYQAPGVVGQIASMNPIAVFVAGPGGLYAGVGGVTVGRFAWVTYPTAGGAGSATNNCLTNLQPSGIVPRMQDGLITIWLAEATLIVPAGYGCTLFVRGDVYAQNTMTDCTPGNQVFANLIDGQVTTAAQGAAAPTAAPGSAALGAATLVAGSYTLVVTANTSGIFAPGQAVSGIGIPLGTFIDTGTAGATGTFQMTNPATTAGTGVVVKAVNVEGNGGFTGTASFATNVMTVTATTTGTLYPGQVVTSAGVAVGTYITSLGTYNGTTGTVNLSTTPGTISAQAATATPWIAVTGWVAKSAGNVGDVIKIGVN